MKVHHLSVSRFRNFEKTEVSFSPRLNLIYGSNGQGKTNLVEALYVLINGKSFRTNLVNSMQMEGQESFSVKGSFSQLDESPIQLKASFYQNHFQIKEQEKKRSRVYLKKNFPTVLFTPDSLSLIKNSEDTRREFFDSVVTTLFPHYLPLYSMWKKLLKSRNKILRNIAQEGASRKNKALIEAINPQFFKVGAEVAYMRAYCIKELKELYNNTSGYMLETSDPITIKYIVSDKEANSWELEDFYQFFHNQFEKRWKMEEQRGISFVGPQRHKIDFIYKNNSARYYCSQGQQRSLIIAFKIAQIVYHDRTNKRSPILLLDDVLSELDAERQIRFMNFCNYR